MAKGFAAFLGWYDTYLNNEKLINIDVMPIGLET